MKLVVVSGLSGAGKSVALKQYEDLGYYCIDNMPLGLLGPLALRALKSTRFAKLAIGIDARGSQQDIARFPKYLDKQRARRGNPGGFSHLPGRDHSAALLRDAAQASPDRQRFVTGRGDSAGAPVAGTNR